MAVVPGEYVFTCGECDGEGEIEVGNRDYGDHEVIQCPDCYGEGQITVDEEEAVEYIEDGADPVRAPAGYSED